MRHDRGCETVRSNSNLDGIRRHQEDAVVVILLCWGRCLATVRHRPLFVVKKPTTGTGSPIGCLGQNRGQKPRRSPEIKDSAIAYGPKGREFESSTARTTQKPQKRSKYAVSGVFLRLFWRQISKGKQYKTIQNYTFGGGKNGGKIMPDPSVSPQASGCHRHCDRRCWRSFLYQHDPSGPLLSARQHLSF